MQMLFFLGVFLGSMCGFASDFGSKKIAEPSPIAAGIYDFKGDFRIQMLAIQEVVNRRYDEQKYLHLKEQEYSCEFKYNMIYLCKKFIPVENSLELTQKINSKYAGFKLEVGISAGPLELVDDSEAFKSWKVNQKVSFPDMSFNDYLLVQKPQFIGAWFVREVYRKGIEIVSDEVVQQTDEIWIKKGSAHLIYYIKIIYQK
ncbi:MAG: hypothetical protein ACK5WZ_05780 [Pseudobdellovibrionaceae bacterium]